MSSASIDQISKEEIIKLAKLSSLELTAEEIDKYQQEVSAILTMIGKLQEIDAEGVEPTYQVSGNKNVTREDVIDNGLVGSKELLDLAPETFKSQIKVKKVL
ncbi:MAG: Asp-tRNA(Asn)/Glu-tRNA(Gln) amidotransferase subunit GatC [Candidatus Nomurabacteria bacterium]|nr:MAG: Asp-tRNA(Asn)/Glu-tRNA(Gln) amidotransferase subunit GatC [Candidatus Nomurabacteria bacterium]HRV76354.1 Asp-tRNA(Asn)/Glu-tRNA(Gln) amidotransferase subunit GatC [Candidatus Saccharimonadales bacterium]